MSVILFLMMLQADGWHFQISQPTFQIESVVIESSEKRGTDSLYVVMFTASWCGPCQSYKSSGQLADLQSQIAVTVSDVDRGGRRWHSGAIPCFWICDKATRRPLRKFAPGVIRPEVILQTARGLIE